MADESAKTMPGEDDVIRARNMINEGLALLMKVSGQELPVTTVKVEKGDTLWHLAEKYLGYGQRYRELFFMNYPTFARYTGTYRHPVDPNWIFPEEEMTLLQV